MSSGKIEVGRYSDFLRRLLAQAGQEEVAAYLAPELQAALVLEADRPEWSFLKNEKLASGQGTSAAAAALRSTVSIENPTGSNVIAVIEEIRVWFNGDFVNIRTAYSTTGQVALTTKRARDFRYGQGNQPGLNLVSNNTLTDAGYGGTTFGYCEAGVALTNYRMHVWRDPIVLGPGTRLGAIGGTDNLAMVATYVWRERAMTRYELA